VRLGPLRLRLVWQARLCQLSNASSATTEQLRPLPGADGPGRYSIVMPADIRIRRTSRS
jgi:hypothetical protein